MVLDLGHLPAIASSGESGWFEFCACLEFRYSDLGFLQWNFGFLKGVNQARPGLGR